MQNIHHETATFEIESDIRLITSDICNRLQHYGNSIGEKFVKPNRSGD